MIVGIAGKKLHGKSTLADLFVQVGYRQVDFADPIRAASKFIFGEAPTSSNKEVVHPTIGFSQRQFMTKFGTDFARLLLHPDFWLRVYQMRTSTGGNIVTADVRFENEAEYIRAQGGCIVHVVRVGFKAPPSDTDSHASEKGIAKDPSDYVLINKGTFADYLEACWQQVERITT